MTYSTPTIHRSATGHRCPGSVTGSRPSSQDHDPLNRAVATVDPVVLRTPGQGVNVPIAARSFERRVGSAAKSANGGIRNYVRVVPGGQAEGDPGVPQRAVAAGDGAAGES